MISGSLGNNYRDKVNDDANDNNNNNNNNNNNRAYK